MCLNVWRNGHGLRSINDGQLFTLLRVFKVRLHSPLNYNSLPITWLEEDLLSVSVYYSCSVLETFWWMIWFLCVYPVLCILAPVAVGQLRDSRRSEPSQKHSLQPLPTTLSGTQTGPSQCCFFWKTYKVNFYGATNQEIGNQVSTKNNIIN